MAKVFVVEKVYHWTSNGKIIILQDSQDQSKTICLNSSSNSEFVSSTLHNSFTPTVAFLDGQSSSHCQTLFSSTSYSTISTKRHTKHDKIRKKQPSVYSKSRRNKQRMANTLVMDFSTEIVIKRLT